MREKSRSTGYFYVGFSMTAISTFNATSARAKALIALHASLSPTQAAAMPDPNDLLRSAVALSIAGMDAYFTDRFAESLVRFLKKHGAKPDLVALLFDAGLDTKAALEMLTMQRPYSEFAPLLRRIYPTIRRKTKRHR